MEQLIAARRSWCQNDLWRVIVEANREDEQEKKEKCKINFFSYNQSLLERLSPELDCRTVNYRRYYRCG